MRKFNLETLNDLKELAEHSGLIRLELMGGKTLEGRLRDIYACTADGSGFADNLLELEILTAQGGSIVLAGDILGYELLPADDSAVAGEPADAPLCIASQLYDRANFFRQFGENEVYEEVDPLDDASIDRFMFKHYGRIRVDDRYVTHDSLDVPSAPAGC